MVHLHPGPEMFPAICALTTLPLDAPVAGIGPAKVIVIVDPVPMLCLQLIAGAPLLLPPGKFRPTPPAPALQLKAS